MDETTRELLTMFDTPLPLGMAVWHLLTKREDGASLARVQHAVGAGLLKQWSDEPGVPTGSAWYSRDFMLTKSGRAACGLSVVDETSQRSLF